MTNMHITDNMEREAVLSSANIHLPVIKQNQGAGSSVILTSHVQQASQTNNLKVAIQSANDTVNKPSSISELNLSEISRVLNNTLSRPNQNNLMLEHLDITAAKPMQGGGIGGSGNTPDDANRRTYMSQSKQPTADYLEAGGIGGTGHVDEKTGRTHPTENIVASVDTMGGIGGSGHITEPASPNSSGINNSSNTPAEYYPPLILDTNDMDSSIVFDNSGLINAAKPADTQSNHAPLNPAPENGTPNQANPSNPIEVNHQTNLASNAANNMQHEESADLQAQNMAALAIKKSELLIDDPNKDVFVQFEHHESVHHAFNATPPNDWMNTEASQPVIG